MRHASGTRRGVTLLEMIVVLTIIASLVCLLLPAVQAAREASRRAGCQMNLHQLGIAMNGFVDANRGPPNPPVDGTMSGWAIDILPFIEEQALADGLSGSPPVSSQAALALAANRPAIMRCPGGYDGDSDVAGVPVSHYRASFGPKRKFWTIGDLPTDSRLPWVVSPEVTPQSPPFSALTLPHTGGFNTVSTDGFGLVHVEFVSRN